MSVQQDTIRRFVNALMHSKSKGMAAANEAVTAATKGLLTSWSSLVDYFVGTVSAHGGNEANDYTYSNELRRTVPTASTHAYLKTYCGIDLTNDDNGALTGLDAGGGVAKTRESVIPKDSLTQYYPTSGSSTYRGLTIVWPSGEIDATARKVVTGLYTWWAKGALDLIAETYGLSCDASPAGSSKMVLEGFYSADTGHQASVIPVSYDGTNLKLSVNLSLLADLDISDGVGRSSKINGFDWLMGHEFTHAVVDSYLGYKAFDLLHSISEGLAQLAPGGDDSVWKICELAQAKNASALREVLLREEQCMDDGSACTAGYMILRFLGHQMALVESTSYLSGWDAGNCYSYIGGGDFTISDYDVSKAIRFDAQYSGVGVSGDSFQLYSPSGTLTVQACRDKLVSVADSNGNLTGYAYMAGAPKTVDGRSYSALEVLVGSNNGSDRLMAGSGGSLQWGGAGQASDTMNGGSGADVFYYGAGDGADYIQGSDASDRVMLYSAMGIQSLHMSGNDLVIQSSEADKLIVRNWNEGGLNNFQLWDGSVYGVRNDGGSITAYRKA